MITVQRNKISAVVFRINFLQLLNENIDSQSESILL